MGRFFTNVIDRFQIAIGIQPRGKYTAVRLTDKDIEEENYKTIIGSRATNWEDSGRFQLHLLRQMWGAVRIIETPGWGKLNLNRSVAYDE